MVRKVITSVNIAALAVLAIAATPASAFGNCFAAFNTELTAFKNMRPFNSSWSARDSYQYAYFFGERGLEILTGYQSCMDAADFAANFKALSDMRDSGREGCQSLNSGAYACSPTYPGN